MKLSRFCWLILAGAVAVPAVSAGQPRYVGSWTDSMSSGLSVGESTWDPAAKRMTGWMEGPDTVKS